MQDEQQPSEAANLSLWYLCGYGLDSEGWSSTSTSRVVGWKTGVSAISCKDTKLGTDFTVGKSVRTFLKHIYTYCSLASEVIVAFALYQCWRSDLQQVL